MAGTDKYNERIRTLIENVQHTQRAPGQEKRRALDRLMESAKGSRDPGLLGIACYYEADSCYTDADYKNYRIFLRKAVENLLQSDARIYLARAYNYVGIDAQNCGAYDIAYGYYMRAITIAQEEKDENMESMADANMARLYAGIGCHDLGHEHLKAAMEKLNTSGNERLYHRNINVMRYLDALNCIAMDDLEGAKEYAAKLEEELDIIPEDFKPELQMAHSFLSARIALEDGDKNEAVEKAGAIALRLRESKQTYDYLEDIEKICKPLTEAGLIAEAKELLVEAAPQFKESGIPHLERRLMAMLAACHEAEGNEDEALACLRRQSELISLQRNEQNRMYLYSIELADLIEHMRYEKERTKRENERLKLQVMTDALTGVGNRNSLNRKIEEAFDRAYEDRTVLGIGILDADSFKAFNDTRGHQAGDRCLVGIANALKRVSERDNVFCARYGGDEFVYIYEGADEKKLIRFAEDVNEEIAAEPAVKGLSVSQGLCSGIPSPSNKLWDYLSAADSALYDIKRANRRSAKKERIRHISL